MEHSFNFFMNASHIILANIHKTVFYFSFLFFFFLFKTPFLSTTKFCMCVKRDETKTSSTFYWAQATWWDLSKHTISDESWAPPTSTSAFAFDQSQPFVPFLHFGATQWELSLAGFVPLVSWLSVSCPRGGQMQSFEWLLGATISLHWRESCCLLV